MATSATSARAGSRTPSKHRALQRRVDQADRRRPKRKSEAAIQAGARAYPEPPFPRQHLSKPGKESRLDPAPLYDAPYYKGSGKLQDKVALITGGDSGIGRSIAVLFAREGADIVIVHLDEAEDAGITRRAVEAEGRRCLVIAGDVSKAKFCETVVKRAVSRFGQPDVLVNPADKRARDVAEFGARTPMKRPAQPKEIAPAFVFLASAHCSSYITGEIPPVVGGYE